MRPYGTPKNANATVPANNLKPKWPPKPSAGPPKAILMGANILACRCRGERTVSRFWEQIERIVQRNPF